ncbi:LysR family transcriptional regulator [Rahnella perminowiae]|uniref:LysR family transcriptional regulator n=1 Tax=Rahnella perminowiae TaxID=2816244 RepID=UPI00224B831D|nr:LysR family transcriptional regulator [Rahnella perminowiae]MCX2945620.1 LysR family transcriptional regulator [Rahnella perminowiae]
MHLDNLADMALFVQIIDSGSLSAAGRHLGLPKATVSRRLALMEQRLGAPLIYRSTRALAPTDFGQRYFQRVQPIVRDAIRAQSEAKSEHARPSGLIRMSAPNAFGQIVLAQILFSFLEQHPGVRIDLRLSDDRVSLVSNGFDLAIRTGPLEDSELVSRRIAAIPMRLVASPAYLAVHGTPLDPAELVDHQSILTRPDLDHWQIGKHIVRPRWNMSTGSMLVSRDALLQHMGIGLLPAFLADPAIKEGKLTPLMLQHALNSEEVSALWARNQTPSLAVSALVNYLVESAISCKSADLWKPS